MRFSISSSVPISRFGLLLHNYPYFLIHLILQIFQHYHYVGIFVLYPTFLHVEAGTGENFNKTTTLTWESTLDLRQKDEQVGINTSSLSCTDDNLNGNCAIIGTQGNNLTDIPDSEESESGGLQAAVDFGILLSFKECQFRFKWNRWNCSEKYWQTNSGTKENAYVTAINSAAVTYSIAKACARGDIPNCGCAPPTTISSGRSSLTSSTGDDPHQGGYWRWGGCSADVDFAAKLARRAIPSSLKKDHRKGHKNFKIGTDNEFEIDKHVLQSVITHNKRVGRNMVHQSLDTDCKCHGVSGSCTLKTCWMKLPQFVKIGRIMFNLYKKSSLVNDSQVGKRHATKKILNSKGPAKRRISLQMEDGGKPSRTRLVHLVPTPTYCDPEGLHPGTRGRRCLRASSLEESSNGSGIIHIENEEGACSILCCGRGYNTHVTWRRWKCRCVFKWCCTVDCEDCEERVQLYTCN